MSEGNKIIRMANQIATFFHSQPASEGPGGVATHINKFWEPRMRRQLFDNFVGARVPRPGTDNLHLDARMRGLKLWPQPGFYVIHHILIARRRDVQDGIGLRAVAQEYGGR